MPKPSVILIRESEEQTTGSGCCGRLEGEFLRFDGKPVFAERRATMEAMGPVYNELRRRFGDAVEIQVVDPRNPFSLLFLLVRDFRAFRVPFKEALKTLGRVPVQAVVLNGRLVARGEWPDPGEVVELLAEVVPRASAQRA